MTIKDYIRFEVSTYALPLVLCALHSNKVKNFSITQEDYNLVISIDAEYLKNICYSGILEDIIESADVNNDK